MSFRAYEYLEERGFFPRNGGGGGGGTSTSTLVTVPDWAQPYVEQYAQMAYDLWQAGTLTTYAGTIIAVQNTDEVEGIDGLATRGRYGDQVITKAIAYLEKIINGELLDGTAAGFLAALGFSLDKSTDAFEDEVLPRIGRKAYYAGDPIDPAYAEGRTNLYAQTLAAPFPATYNARMQAAMFAENWLKERGIQQHGLGFGVEMGKHAAIDAEALRRAGLYQRDYIQSTYLLSHKLFTEQQELEIVKLEIFGNCLRALTGSQQSTSQTQEGNKMMQSVGGVMAGASLGYMVTGGNPIGALVGGAIGGIIGWFA